MKANVENIEKILATEKKQFKKLNAIVLESIEEEKLISDKLAEFEEKEGPLKNLIADKIAIFGGSWSFIIFFLVFMLLWMGLNTYLLQTSFDPYPFILLNLLLSTIAALQAPLILMSQNRKEEKDRKRSVNDYMINLKAEIEVRKLHQKLDLLISEQMKLMFDIQKREMDLMENIRKELQQKAV